MSACLYILESLKNGKYYIGASEDVERRLGEHNRGNTTSTRKYKPWKIIYTEGFESIKEAKQREKQIKKWKSKVAIQRLISQGDRAAPT